MKIVLDKSLLEGSSADTIQELCSQHQVIMPEVLLLEVLTTESKSMVKCFKKFPEIENPLALVPNVGSLIRYETENNRQRSPIESQFLKIH